LVDGSSFPVKIFAVNNSQGELQGLQFSPPSGNLEFSLRYAKGSGDLTLKGVTVVLVPRGLLPGGDPKPADAGEQVLVPGSTTSSSPGGPAVTTPTVEAQGPGPNVGGAPLPTLAPFTASGATKPEAREVKLDPREVGLDAPLKPGGTGLVSISLNKPFLREFLAANSEASFNVFGVVVTVQDEIGDVLEAEGKIFRPVFEVNLN
jgi:hypothetical protein